MIRSIKRKLSGSRGTTLVEMLVTTIILLLASSAMVAGVTFASRSFEKVFSQSESQMLCSTLKTTISDELYHTKTIYVDGNDRFRGYFSQKYGKPPAEQDSFISVDSNDRNAVFGRIRVAGHDLISPASYTHNIRAAVSVDADLVMKSGVKKVDRFRVTLRLANTDNRVILQDEFAVIPLNDPDVELEGTDPVAGDD